MIQSTQFLSRISATNCYNDDGYCIDVTKASCEGLLKTGYCQGPSNILCCVENSTVPQRCFGEGPLLIPSSYLFTLNSQGFDDHPGALVYVPSNFNRSVNLVMLK